MLMLIHVFVINNIFETIVFKLKGVYIPKEKKQIISYKYINFVCIVTVSK